MFMSHPVMASQMKKLRDMCEDLITAEITKLKKEINDHDPIPSLLSYFGFSIGLVASFLMMMPCV